MTLPIGMLLLPNLTQLDLTYRGHPDHVDPEHVEAVRRRFEPTYRARVEKLRRPAP